MPLDAGFSIFAAEPSGKARFLERVFSLAEAEARVEELMKVKKLDYIIVCNANGSRTVIKPASGE